MKAAQKNSDDKDEPVKMTFIWSCKCGSKNFNTWDYCGACGNFKPPPSVPDSKGKK